MRKENFALGGRGLRLRCGGEKRERGRKGKAARGTGELASRRGVGGSVCRGVTRGGAARLRGRLSRCGGRGRWGRGPA